LINIRPKTKLAETLHIAVFGAETETEIRSVSSSYLYLWTDVEICVRYRPRYVCEVCVYFTDR